MADVLAGRYRLGETLGRGGMGWVQRADDPISGRQVAIKFIHPEGASEQLATAFSWEVGAVARLDHPAIVPLFDFGRSDEAGPYIVMGLSPGTPLNQIDRSAITWPAFCAILEGILGVLSHTHARGVFHHDLKPGNVLVYADGAGAVHLHVIDFGIAGVLGQQALGHGAGPTALVGTASYLAPESVRDFTLYRFAASPDIYALGVIAYELAYGVRPFVSEDVREVLRQHQEEDPPVHPFRAGFEAPQQIHFFIRKMLMKNPRERFGSAAEVLALLRQLAPPGTLDGHLRTSGLPGPRYTQTGVEVDAEQWSAATPHDHSKLMGVRTPPFAGRQPERHFLSTRQADCVMRKSARIILLTGPSGVGKSRLIRQIAEWAAESGRAATAIAPYSLLGSDSLEGWRAVVLSLLGYAGSSREQVARVIDEDLAWLGLTDQLEPDIVLDLLFPGQDEEAGESGEQAVLDFDWVGSFIRLLVSLARKRPLFLALEDVAPTHDGRGIEVLEFLLREDEVASITVVLSMRSENLGQPGLAEAQLKRLERYNGFVISRVGALNHHEMEELLDGLMPLSDTLRERIIRGADGFPIYAVQLLRLWVRTGILQAENGRYTVTGAFPRLPETITDIWRGRLDTLAGSHSPAHVALLQRAAVMGEPFTYEGLLELVRCETREDLSAALEEAWSSWHAEGLCEQMALGQSVFAHPTLIDAALERIAPAELAALHRASAQALLRSSQPGPGGTVLTIARHYGEANLPQEAFPFYVRAAREAHHEGRHLAAVSHCRQAAQLLVEMGAGTRDRRWAVVYRLLADALLRLARYDDVEEIAWRLESRARHWNDDLHRATALRLVGVSAWRRGQPAQAEEYLLEARRLFEEAGVHRELGRCELELGELWKDHHPPAQVRERYRLARRNFAHVRDSRGTARALLCEARLLREVGELETAERFLKDADNIFSQLSDRSGRADVVRHRGRLRLFEGRFGAALDALAQASQMYRAIGEREGEALCSLETGFVYRTLGELSQAQQCLRRAREELIALGNRSRSIEAHLGLVQLAVDSHHFEASLPHLEQLLGEVRRMGDQRSEMIAETLSARCHAELGRWPEADMALFRADEILGLLHLVDLDVARQLERITEVARDNAQSVIAATAKEACIGIWRRLRRTDELERLGVPA